MSTYNMDQSRLSAHNINIQPTQQQNDSNKTTTNSALTTFDRPVLRVSSSARESSSRSIQSAHLTNIATSSNDHDEQQQHLHHQESHFTASLPNLPSNLLPQRPSSASGDTTPILHSTQPGTIHNSNNNNSQKLSSTISITPTNAQLRPSTHQQQQQQQQLQQQHKKQPQQQQQTNPSNNNNNNNTNNNLQFMNNPSQLTYTPPSNINSLTQPSHLNNTTSILQPLGNLFDPRGAVTVGAGFNDFFNNENTNFDPYWLDDDPLELSYQSPISTPLTTQNITRYCTHLIDMSTQQNTRINLFGGLLLVQMFDFRNPSTMVYGALGTEVCVGGEMLTDSELHLKMAARQMGKEVQNLKDLIPVDKNTKPTSQNVTTTTPTPTQRLGSNPNGPWPLQLPIIAVPTSNGNQIANHPVSLPNNATNNTTTLTLNTGNSNLNLLHPLDPGSLASPVPASPTNAGGILNNNSSNNHHSSGSNSVNATPPASSPLNPTRQLRLQPSQQQQSTQHTGQMGQISVLSNNNNKSINGDQDVESNTSNIESQGSNRPNNFNLPNQSTHSTTHLERAPSPLHMTTLRPTNLTNTNIPSNNNYSNNHNNSLIYDVSNSSYNGATGVVSADGRDSASLFNNFLNKPFGFGQVAGSSHTSFISGSTSLISQSTAGTLLTATPASQRYDPNSGFALHYLYRGGEYIPIRRSGQRVKNKITNYTIETHQIQRTSTIDSISFRSIFAGMQNGYVEDCYEQIPLSYNDPALVLRYGSKLAQTTHYNTRQNETNQANSNAPIVQYTGRFDNQLPINTFTDIDHTSAIEKSSCTTTATHFSSAAVVTNNNNNTNGNNPNVPNMLNNTPNQTNKSLELDPSLSTNLIPQCCYTTHTFNPYLASMIGAGVDYTCETDEETGRKRIELLHNRHLYCNCGAYIKAKRNAQERRRQRQLEIQQKEAENHVHVRVEHANANTMVDAVKGGNTSLEAILVSLVGQVTPVITHNTPTMVVKMTPTVGAMNNNNNAGQRPSSSQGGIPALSLGKSSVQSQDTGDISNTQVNGQKISSITPNNNNPTFTNDNNNNNNNRSSDLVISQMTPKQRPLGTDLLQATVSSGNMTSNDLQAQLDLANDHAEHEPCSHCVAYKEFVFKFPREHTYKPKKANGDVNDEDEDENDEDLYDEIDYFEGSSSLLTATTSYEPNSRSYIDTNPLSHHLTESMSGTSSVSATNPSSFTQISLVSGTVLGGGHSNNSTGGEKHSNNNNNTFTITPLTPTTTNPQSTHSPRSLVSMNTSSKQHFLFGGQTSSHSTHTSTNPANIPHSAYNNHHHNNISLHHAKDPNIITTNNNMTGFPNIQKPRAQVYSILKTSPYYIPKSKRTIPTLQEYIQIRKNKLSGIDLGDGVIVYPGDGDDDDNKKKTRSNQLAQSDIKREISVMRPSVSHMRTASYHGRQSESQNDPNGIQLGNTYDKVPGQQSSFDPRSSFNQLDLAGSKYKRTSTSSKTGTINGDDDDQYGDYDRDITLLDSTAPNSQYNRDHDFQYRSHSPLSSSRAEPTSGLQSSGSFTQKMKLNEKLTSPSKKNSSKNELVSSHSFDKTSKNGSSTNDRTSFRHQPNELSSNASGATASSARLSFKPTDSDIMGGRISVRRPSSSSSNRDPVVLFTMQEGQEIIDSHSDMSDEEQSDDEQDINKAAPTNNKSNHDSISPKHSEKSNNTATTTSSITTKSNKNDESNKQPTKTQSATATTTTTAAAATATTDATKTVQTPQKASTRKEKKPAKRVKIFLTATDIEYVIDLKASHQNHFLLAVQQLYDYAKIPYTEPNYEKVCISFPTTLSPYDLGCYPYMTPTSNIQFSSQHYCEPRDSPPVYFVPNPSPIDVNPRIDSLHVDHIHNNMNSNINHSSVLNKFGLGGLRTSGHGDSESSFTYDEDAQFNAQNGFNSNNYFNADQFGLTTQYTGTAHTFHTLDFLDQDTIQLIHSAIYIPPEVIQEQIQKKRDLEAKAKLDQKNLKKKERIKKARAMANEKSSHVSGSLRQHRAMQREKSNTGSQAGLDNDSNHTISGTTLATVGELPTSPAVSSLNNSSTPMSEIASPLVTLPTPNESTLQLSVNLDDDNDSILPTPTNTNHRSDDLDKLRGTLNNQSVASSPSNHTNQEPTPNIVTLMTKYGEILRVTKPILNADTPFLKPYQVYIPFSNADLSPDPTKAQTVRLTSLDRAFTRSIHRFVSQTLSCIDDEQRKILIERMIALGNYNHYIFHQPQYLSRASDEFKFEITNLNKRDLDMVVILDGEYIPHSVRVMNGSGTLVYPPGTSPEQYNTANKTPDPKAATNSNKDVKQDPKKDAKQDPKKDAKQDAKKDVKQDAKKDVKDARKSSKDSTSKRRASTHESTNRNEIPSEPQRHYDQILVDEAVHQVVAVRGDYHRFVVTPDIPNPNLQEVNKDQLANYYLNSNPWQNLDYGFLNSCTLHQVITVALGKVLPTTLFKIDDKTINKDKKSDKKDNGQVVSPVAALLGEQFDIGATVPFPSHYHPYHPHYFSTASAIALCNPTVGPGSKRLAAAVLTNQATDKKKAKKGEAETVVKKITYSDSPNDINLDLNTNPLATLQTFQHSLRYGLNYKSFSNQNCLNDVIWLVKNKKNVVTRHIAKAFGFFSKSFGMKKDRSKLHFSEGTSLDTLDELQEKRQFTTNDMAQENPGSDSNTTNTATDNNDRGDNNTNDQINQSKDSKSTTPTSSAGAQPNTTANIANNNHTTNKKPSDATRTVTFNLKVDVNSVNDKPRFKYSPNGVISSDCIKKGGCNHPGQPVRSNLGQNTYIYTIPIDVNLQSIYSQTFVLQTYGSRGCGMDYTCYTKLIEGLPFAIIPAGRLPLHEKTYDGFGLPSIQKQPRRYRVTTPTLSFPTPASVLNSLIEISNDPVRLQRKRQYRQSRLNKRQRESDRQREQREHKEPQTHNGVASGHIDKND